MMRAWKKFTVDLRQFENSARRNRDGHLIAAVPRCGGNSEFRREGRLRQFLSLKFWPLGLMLFLLTATPLHASQPLVEEPFAPETIGHWTGSARIIVSWSKQTNLGVTLNIRDDATVTGKVGDALLINGR